MKSYTAKKESVDRKWVVVDAEGAILGRLASQIALILRGKNKPTFTPHVDTGDFVVVVNAAKIQLTGNKGEEKNYFWYTGHPGGIRSVTAGELLKSKPDEVIRKAVQGMLPKSKLGQAMIRKLKVYGGPDHPHEAQQPVKITV